MSIVYKLIYFILVTPAGVILRLFGYDPLELSQTKERATAFRTRDHNFTKADFETS